MKDTENTMTVPLSNDISEEKQTEFTPSCSECRNYARCSLSRLSAGPELKAMQGEYSAALRNDEMELYLQFIYGVKEDTAVGVEALSRWNHPELGILPPARYIKGMHFAGISDRLDFCMLEKSCRLLEYWQSIGLGGLSLSCNFTRTTFSMKSFASEVLEIIGRYSFDRSRLTLELTEDTIISDPAAALKNMLACKKAGLTIALDDLGAGYSSFRDLCDYPVDFIKIDRCITLKAATERGFSMLKGVCALAHDMGMKVLCEGVETEEERSAVIAAGSDYIQGFYYSRVCPVPEAMKLYRDKWAQR